MSYAPSALNARFQSAAVRFVVASIVGLILIGATVECVRLVSAYREQAWLSHMAEWYESQAADSHRRAAKYMAEAITSPSPMAAGVLLLRAKELSEEAAQLAHKSKLARAESARKTFNLWPG